MKILFIGIGSIGCRHIQNIHNKAKVDIGAYDTNPSQLASLKKIIPRVQIFNSLEDAWDYTPEVVFITTPTSLHINYALEAAKRGYHLFIEKPLSHNLVNTQNLAAIIKQKHLISMVGCNMRFYWAISRIKQLLKDNAIGKIYAAQIESSSYLPQWRKNDYREIYSAQKKLGGGIILDAIHELDYAVWFFGNVTKLTSMYGKLSNLQIDTEDVADMLLKFAAGPIVNIHVDYIRRDYSRRCIIVGEKGTIAWNSQEHKVRLFSSLTKTWKLYEEPKSSDINQMYIDEIKYFLKCVVNKQKTFNDVQTAAAVLRLALTAKKPQNHVK